MAHHHELSVHPLAGGIAFVVERALRNGTPIAVAHYAERLLQATPGRQTTFAALEAEIQRIAVRDGAVLELT